MVLTIEPVSKRQVTIIPAIFNLTVGHLATVFLKTMDEPNFSFPPTGRLFAVGCPCLNLCFGSYNPWFPTVVAYEILVDFCEFSLLFLLFFSLQRLHFCLDAFPTQVRILSTTPFVAKFGVNKTIGGFSFRALILNKRW
jgi:hypothetical protein